MLAEKVSQYAGQAVALVIAGKCVCMCVASHCTHDCSLLGKGSSGHDKSYGIMIVGKK